MTYFEPEQLTRMEREEQQARMRLVEIRNREELDDGEAPASDKRALQMLEEDWKRAKARLERFRKTHKPD